MTNPGKSSAFLCHNRSRVLGSGFGVFVFVGVTRLEVLVVGFASDHGTESIESTVSSPDQEHWTSISRWGASDTKYDAALPWERATFYHKTALHFPRCVCCVFVGPEDLIEAAELKE